MLPALFKLGALAFSTLSATAEAALIGASVGAATALGTGMMKRSRQPPAPPSCMDDRTLDFDAEVLEAVVKQALKTAYQYRKNRYPAIE